MLTTLQENARKSSELVWRLAEDFEHRAGEVEEHSRENHGFVTYENAAEARTWREAATALRAESKNTPNEG